MQYKKAGARHGYFLFVYANVGPSPPGVPQERVKLLREAFMRAMNDPAFLDEVKRKKLAADPSSGEELEAIAKEAMAQPREVVEQMKKLLGK